MSAYRLKAFTDREPTEAKFVTWVASRCSSRSHDAAEFPKLADAERHASRTMLLRPDIVRIVLVNGITNAELRELSVRDRAQAA